MKLKSVFHLILFILSPVIFSGYSNGAVAASSETDRMAQVLFGQQVVSAPGSWTSVDGNQIQWLVRHVNDPAKKWEYLKRTGNSIELHKWNDNKLSDDIAISTFSSMTPGQITEAIALAAAKFIRHNLLLTGMLPNSTYGGVKRQWFEALAANDAYQWYFVEELDDGRSHIRRWGQNKDLAGAHNQVMFTVSTETIGALASIISEPDAELTAALKFSNDYLPVSTLKLVSRPGFAGKQFFISLFNYGNDNKIRWGYTDMRGDIYIEGQDGNFRKIATLSPSFTGDNFIDFISRGPVTATQSQGFMRTAQGKYIKSDSERQERYVEFNQTTTVLTKTFISNFINNVLRIKISSDYAPPTVTIVRTQTFDASGRPTLDQYRYYDKSGKLLPQIPPQVTTPGNTGGNTGGNSDPRRISCAGVSNSIAATENTLRLLRNGTKIACSGGKIPGGNKRDMCKLNQESIRNAEQGLIYLKGMAARCTYP